MAVSLQADAFGVSPLDLAAPADSAAGASEPARSDGSRVPPAARLYVAIVIMAGGAALARAAVHTDYTNPLFLGLLVGACLLSAWKVSLPIPVTNGSTLSVADAANIMSLLLLGPSDAALITAAGVLVQCTYKSKEPYPLHRTVFSIAAAGLTMLATGAAFAALGGSGVPPDFTELTRPLGGALAAYFAVNTTLVAAAIALSTRRSMLDTWRKDFLWSASSFMVAGVAGALAAVIVSQGEQWTAALLIVPIYLTYRTYLAFVGRIESEHRHTDEMRRLHGQTVDALQQAREAERALADEKERLATALAEMTRLEELQHELLEREQASRAAAETANRVKDQFLAIVSHELRTPLNAILGWADMLHRGTLDEARRERAARSIRDGARRQAQLIDDLLDVARISSGKLRLQRAIVDLRDVVHDALQVVQPLAEAKGVRVRVDVMPGIDGVYGDAARLQQVVWNLLSNAVKFTTTGGTVQIAVRQVRETIELTIADSGQGIAREFLPMIFEPFRQADSSSTRAHPGLGLGLAIVRSLVEAHNGQITADSPGQGQGATFVVRLPSVMLRAAADELGAAPAPGRPDDALALDGVVVVLVDDDPDSREVVSTQLQEWGAIVATAATASQAFDLVRSRHVDVLVADIGMPDEDGYSLIRRIRAMAQPEAASVPAAALTALARREDRQQALQAGFQLHLAKPVDPAALMAAVLSLHRLNTV
jgi:signal transduction histidine kinase/ActR/RegA family two-component response regulator